MRAIALEQGRYSLRELPVPVPAPSEVAIRVVYAGVNRADLFQLQGRYPLPEGNPAIPGLEVSGEIIACGADVRHFSVGDKVCALLSEGGYAEVVCAPAAHTLPVPEGLSLAEAACLPEACFTVWISLVWQARLAPGERVLIHGGAGGIGSMAIQIARVLGAQVYATAGTEEKCEACRNAGAYAIAYTQEDFVSVINDRTQGRGVDVVLDMVGGDYFNRNLACLAQGGRLCIIAFLQGAKVSANLAPVLLKHLTVTGSTLRSRPVEEKSAIATEIRQRLWPLLTQQQGTKPLIANVFPLVEAEKALAYMDQGLNVGKILLSM